MCGPPLLTFLWVLRIQTQTLILSWQMLSRKSHFLRRLTSHRGEILLFTASNQFISYLEMWILLKGFQYEGARVDCHSSRPQRRRAWMAHVPKLRLTFTHPLKPHFLCEQQVPDMNFVTGFISWLNLWEIGLNPPFIFQKEKPLHFKDNYLFNIESPLGSCTQIFLHIVWHHLL